MKKIYGFVSFTIVLLMTGIGVYADNGNTNITIGRVEAIDAIIWIGIGVFLLGMLFVLLSFRAGKNKQNIEYDEYIYDEEEYEDSDYNELEYSDDCCEDEAIDEQEEFEDDEVIEAIEEEIEKEDEAEAEVEEEAEEAVEEVNSEIKSVSEPEIAPEPEIIAEPEKKVRITLTGINNSDVKVMEFSNKISIGRRVGNDILISDTAVSGKHCELSLENGVLYVTDLESTNGTYVNDEAIVRSEIKSGDTLILGKCKYRINVSIG